MTRAYGRLYVDIWSPTSDFRLRTAGAQRLYFVLISHPMLSACGTLPLQIRKWSQLAPNTTEESVRKALDELVEHRYIVVDEHTEEALVRTYIRHDGRLDNPNQRTAVQRAMSMVESTTIVDVLVDEWNKAVGHVHGLPTVEPAGQNGSTRPSGRALPTALPLALPTAPLTPTSTSTSTYTSPGTPKTTSKQGDLAGFAEW
jgi:hypothetical protein